MSNVIDLNIKKDPKAVKLFELGGDVDQLVLFYVNEHGLDLFEISAIISHRLGECIKHLPAKEHQADILIDIILKRAGLSNE